MRTPNEMLKMRFSSLFIAFIARNPSVQSFSAAGQTAFTTSALQKSGISFPLSPQRYSSFPQTTGYNEYAIQGRHLSTALWDSLVDASSANVETPEQTYFIRRANRQDMGPASEILADGFFKGKVNFLQYYLERLETYLSMESSFPALGTLHEVFIACDSRNGKVIGVVEVDARTDKTGRGQHGPYMCNLSVQQKYQRQGIAKSLVREAEKQVEEWCKETDTIKSLYLQVRQSNDAAVTMYDSLGYRCYLQDKNAKGEIILSMRRNLPDTES